MRIGAHPALLVAALLTGCSGGDEMRDVAPAVWVLRDADTTLYITGTVHLLPDNMDWRNGPITVAIASADELITELSPTEVEAAGRIAPDYFLGPRDQAPVSRFVPDLQDDYRRFAADKLPALPTIARFDDWALALLMAQAIATDAGLEGDNGVDKGLIDEFRAAGRPTSGLERAADQFGRFDAIPPPEQRAMLDRMMREIVEGKADDRLLETVETWARGDVDALGTLITRDARLAPVTHRLLLVERNRLWADWTQTRMQRPGTILMAVGAGHLAGPDSLIAMLEADGLTPQRMP
jgi:uncharacterized protein